jgi:DNA primase
MNIEDLLVDKNISYTPKGKDFVIKCLNPEHEDRNPSLRVDQITGVFNCFACGFKGNILQHFGEKANALQMQRNVLKKKIEDKMSSSVGLTLPTGYMPYVGNWRGITPETYRKFEAFQHHDKDYIGRLVFPVRDIAGRIVAFNGRHMSGGVPKYLIRPAGAKLPLYPSVDPIKGSVILVEGIYDAINLYDKGLTNAVCCFGTNNINADKLSMLLMRGIENVEIFFDGDEAGQKGAEKVRELCGKVGLVSRNIHLEGMDPGALSSSQVENLKRKLYA